MHLTDEEKRMRDGAEGDAVAAAMDLLIRYGEALGAERLCDTRNVAGTMTQPSPAKAKLVEEGGWAKAFAVINLDCDDDIDVPRMRVPTCQLQHGFSDDAAGLSKYSVSNIELQGSAESYFSERGVNILATCTPYQVGNLPVRNEHCAWMESSAVVYCNSVLGARTNCEGAASTGAAGLTGKIPYWGNHVPENRFANRLVRADVPVESFQDWGMFGYFVGGQVEEERPAVIGALAQPDLANLKHFGAATATSGGVEIYHIPGITPEAPSLEAAFGGRAIPDAATYGPAERRAVYETLNSQGDSDDVDFILLGCPHASLDQIAEIARLLDGKRLRDGTELWVMTPRALRIMADRNGYTEAIERAGGKLLTDSCPAMSKAAPDGVRVFATDSAKQAHYLPAILGIEAWFGTLEECVSAALTGKWRGELAA
ncbi:aconitase X catalytic domain-containing protein [Microbacterium sp.]|uniref:aconitase X catalytic domain-containing protein n=1 Tax=Microbacterium sp. TaxID=51671 RepID=UPI002D76CB85|nr:aconitase X catalytic domain-containing protein [Microbacterium sp.]HET6300532.1 aconitase X catalytic domain-containing protein [Microbacterium sp.]